MHGEGTKRVGRRALIATLGAAGAALAGDAVIGTARARASIGDPVFDGQAGPLSVGSSVRLRTGFASPGSGGDATWSINGPLAANAVDNEHPLKNSWGGAANATLSIQNTARGNDVFSALRLLDRAGEQKGALAYGNTGSSYDFPYAGATYLQSTNSLLANGGYDFTRPALPLRLMTVGVINGVFGQHARMGLESDGTVRFWKPTADAFSAREDVFVIDAVARTVRSTAVTTVDPSNDNANALIVRNRHASGYSAVEVRDSNDSAVLFVGHGNSSAGTYPNVTYVVTNSTSTTPKGFVLAQQYSGGGVPRIVLEIDNASRFGLRDINGTYVVRGGGSSAVLGFFGATPVAQQSVGAAATDPASTHALVNDIRSKLRTLGLFA